MIWPSICVDNFFDDPTKVKEFAYSLEYKKDEEGKWPGYRTGGMHEVDFKFFNWTTLKIISLLYPMNYRDVSWTAEQTFQRIPGKTFKNKGWVHKDYEEEFTAIIYLSNHKDCGTSLYRPKKFGNKIINEELKREILLNKGTNNKKNLEEEKYLNENNDQFEKILEFKSIFNRLVIFDSHNFHAAENFYNEDLNEDRLTLITFFKHINIPNIKYPITEMKRI
jgi:hypothetical protein